jgi:hypothetical protein
VTVNQIRSAVELREAYRRALNEPEPGSIMTLTEEALNRYLYTLVGWSKTPPYKGQRYADDDWTGPDGNVHDCEYGGCPPDYAENTDDALMLFPVPNMVMLFRATDTDNHWHCSVNSASSRLRDHGEGSGETPALAVCRAYIEWKSYQDGTPSGGEAP